MIGLSSVYVRDITLISSLLDGLIFATNCAMAGEILLIFFCSEMAIIKIFTSINWTNRGKAIQFGVLRAPPYAIETKIDGWGRKTVFVKSQAVKQKLQHIVS